MSKKNAKILMLLLVPIYLFACQIKKDERLSFIDTLMINPQTVFHFKENEISYMYWKKFIVTHTLLDSLLFTHFKKYQTRYSLLSIESMTGVNGHELSRMIITNKYGYDTMNIDFEKIQDKWRLRLITVR